MPKFKCDPDVLISTLGSISGVRRTLLQRGATNIVSESGNDLEHVLVADHPVHFFRLCLGVGHSNIC